MITDVGYDLNSFANSSPFLISPSSSRKNLSLEGSSTTSGGFYQLTFGSEDLEDDELTISNKLEKERCSEVREQKRNSKVIFTAAKNFIL